MPSLGRRHWQEHERAYEHRERILTGFLPILLRITYVIPDWNRAGFKRPTSESRSKTLAIMEKTFAEC